MNIPEEIRAIAVLAEAPLESVRHCVAEGDINLGLLVATAAAGAVTFDVPSGFVLAVTEMKFWSYFRDEANEIDFSAQERGSLGLACYLYLSHTGQALEPTGINYHARDGGVFLIFPAGQVTVTLDVATTTDLPDYTLSAYVRAHGYLLPAMYEGNLRRHETRRL